MVTTALALQSAQHASFHSACGVLALDSLRPFEVQAMRRSPSHHPPASRRPLSQLAFDSSLGKATAHRGAILVTSRALVQGHQPLSSTSKSFAMTILPVSSMESRSCEPNRKSLKTGSLRMKLSPMFGRSYEQVRQNKDLTIFNFSRFFSCPTHFASTS